MFQEAKNAMERTLYMAVSPRTYENIRRVAKVGTVGGALTTAASFVPYALNKAAAYAAEVCDKAQYTDLVNKFNPVLDYFAALLPNATAQAKFQHAFGYSDLDDLLTIRQCLISNNTNPDSVARMGNHLADAVNYADSIHYIPELEGLAVGVAGTAFFVTVLAPKITPYVKKGAQKISNHFSDKFHKSKKDN